MFEETTHILSYGSADYASVKFTRVARNVDFWTHTRSKTLTPLVNCIVNHARVHGVSNVQQTLLQFVNAVQLRLMHLLLDVTPYLVIDRINFGAIRRPQIWRNKSGC